MASSLQTLNHTLLLSLSQADLVVVSAPVYAKEEKEFCFVSSTTTNPCFAMFLKTYSELTLFLFSLSTDNNVFF